ncbi:ankyrin repeat-containing domain protein [Fimicolochytrium jonesii]|uniref:ankyrin repeat-containing domain protein n=1 Tax=Fimicolochytrium jonesii TaxID=1396493 RepID=UPI0022FEA61D|nr:ankyrin repeat-containing domain protein [Fimicolochytrium jonesii]KAI8818268.1 ankyrin repeat-containing domain protein [Fimicolochytrium jonesii]
MKVEKMENTLEMVSVASSGNHDLHFQLFLTTVQANNVDLLLRWLKDKHPPLSTRDHKGCSFIWHATKCNAEQCLEILLKEIPANSNTIVDADGEASLTPLHIAAWHGYEGCLRLLLSHVNGRGLLQLTDGNGQTPLHIAALHGHEGCLRLLLNHVDDADLSKLKDNSKRTPPDLAATNGKVGCLSLLLEHQGERLRPVLHDLIDQAGEHSDCSRLLIRHGKPEDFNYVPGVLPFEECATLLRFSVGCRSIPPLFYNWTHSRHRPRLPLTLAGGILDQLRIRWTDPKELNDSHLGKFNGVGLVIDVDSSEDASAEMKCTRIAEFLSGPVKQICDSGMVMHFHCEYDGFL